MDTKYQYLMKSVKELSNIEIYLLEYGSWCVGTNFFGAYVFC